MFNFGNVLTYSMLATAGIYLLANILMAIRIVYEIRRKKIYAGVEKCSHGWPKEHAEKDCKGCRAALRAEMTLAESKKGGYSCDGKMSLQLWDIKVLSTPAPSKEDREKLLKATEEAHKDAKLSVSCTPQIGLHPDAIVVAGEALKPGESIYINAEGKAVRYFPLVEGEPEKPKKRPEEITSRWSIGDKVRLIGGDREGVVGDLVEKMTAGSHRGLWQIRIGKGSASYLHCEAPYNLEKIPEGEEKHEYKEGDEVRITGPTYKHRVGTLSVKHSPQSNGGWNITFQAPYVYAHFDEWEFEPYKPHLMMSPEMLKQIRQELELYHKARAKVKNVKGLAFRKRKGLYFK